MKSGKPTTKNPPLKKEAASASETPTTAKGRRGVGRQHPSKEQPAPAKQQRWVVVIHNVENEFSRIHREAVERYCSLNPAARDERSAKYGGDHAVKNDFQSGTSARLSSSSLPKATYLLKPRQETRSVEVKVYAENPQADVSSIWLPVAMASTQSGGKLQTATEQTTAAAAPYMAEASAAAADNVDDASIPSASGAGAATCNVARLTPRYAAVSDMISVLKYKPYFTHPPLLMLGPPCEQSMGNSNGRDDATADGELSAAGAAAAAAAPSRHGKRSRESEDPSSGAEAPSEGRRVLEGIRQSSLVTASVVSSSHTTARTLRRVLSDIPGFVSCWSLHALTFRIVFRDEEAMFGAKLLLDQFEAEGLRLAIQLPDAAQKRFEEFAERQGETTEENV